MSAKQYLTWGAFDDAVDRLTLMLSGVRAGGVYGVPRGGLILAVALSHRLNLPLHSAPQLDSIWVDDIVDSGRTRDTAPPAAAYVAWFSRAHRWDTRVARVCQDDAWLVFPWEAPERAAADHHAYEVSRNVHQARPQA